jgi:hypothetical protein
MPAWQPHGFENTSVDPVADGVLVDTEPLSGGRHSNKIARLGHVDGRYFDRNRRRPSAEVQLHGLRLGKGRLGHEQTHEAGRNLDAGWGGDCHTSILSVSHREETYKFYNTHIITNETRPAPASSRYPTTPCRVHATLRPGGRWCPAQVSSTI